MAAGGGIVHIPWYATFFRGDGFSAALEEIAPIALRYGATDYMVFRSKDDTYKFLQTAAFEDELDFTRYWEGPEFIEFRVRYSGWFQVPVLYTWNALVARGGVEPDVVKHAQPAH